MTLYEYPKAKDLGVFGLVNICFAPSLSATWWYMVATLFFVISLPTVFIVFVNETVLRIPVLNSILVYFGKHSINIFLTHTFIRSIYFEEFTYSFKHFILICAILLAISLVISIVIDFLKKIIFYNKLTDKILWLLLQKSKILLKLAVNYCTIIL